MLRFFIDRPIFSSVISIIIVIAGLTSLSVLPVEQYPQVVPPQVVVTANWPGASAEVMAESVAAPLEQEINGVEDMIYMESTSTDAGSLQIIVTFEMGTDPDQATINVNNRVQAGLPRVPQQVRDQGVRVESRSTNILMVPVLYSPEGSHDTLFISNYALLNVIDELVRLPGVGDASLFGSQDYSMRIWIYPDKLAEYGLTTTDLATAIREQNAQFAAGELGAEPSLPDQAFTYTVTTRGQLSEPEEFEKIILRANHDGSFLRLGDVARAELGAQSYAFSATYNKKPTVPIGIYLQPGANALETATAVKSALENISQRFPDDVEYGLPYDTTEFIEISIKEVFITLLAAIVLVALVTFLFLQHIRATIIPVTAIPVSLIGTFAGMQMLGFSVNLLTLFGLVLAIGIVVDDAILVLENVDRLIREQGLRARDAAIETMKQVSGPIVSTTLVLVAVFAPVAFLGGMSGVLYRQFAVTIAVSVIVSSVVALTLTPAMCALLLDKQSRHVYKPFRIFNAIFKRLTDFFIWVVGKLIVRPLTGLILFLIVITSTVFLIDRLPPGLVPQEDQGVIMVIYQLPPVSSLSRTEKVRADLSDMLLSMDEIEEFTTFAGFDIFSFSLRSNAGVGFAKLSDWNKRRSPGQDATSITYRIMGMSASIPEANVFAVSLPPIQGMSLTGGVEGYLQVREDATPGEIEALAWELLSAANQRPELTNARTTLDTGIPRYLAEVDRDKSRSVGVPINQVFDSMQSTFGSLYVNDFTLMGRVWRVNLQSESEFRSQPEDLNKVFVRSDYGEMIPLSSLVTLERKPGTDILNRFNVNTAAKLMADASPGYTTGQVKDAIEEVAAQVLDTGKTILGWTGEAYQIDAARGAGGVAFLLGLVMVFLILAALYERWTLPLAVTCAVPFAVMGAAIAVLLRGFANDIYFQVGLLVLIGLSTKISILIVEFAAQNRREGMTAYEAATTAARQRFRAIVMTAMTFIIGTMPLVFATGAGASSRQEIGTVVVGGMIFTATLALIFVPLAYKLLEDFISWKYGTD